ncbi:non-specific lipid-transfer protein-like protein At5g64080 [Triticum dicoccoides]|uniref:non-specific lipid-transfer protein-like protein At5g64080 n=1 Tax=Triticum dicoccoides TaxID=85692 RepID=UPI00188ED866|nr:non-specific lipid-transfer protein-like protein At5g64080 [Triticum dicoccoides]
MNHEPRHDGTSTGRSHSAPESPASSLRSSIHPPMARSRSGGLSFSSALSLGLAVLAVTWAASTAQQQPPAVPSPGVSVPSCPPVQASLSPCVSYFIGNSSSPSDACCVQMRALFQSQAPCLCAAVSAVPSQLGSVVGGLLPTACDLPPNACSAVTGTTSSAPAPSSSTGTPTDAAAAAPVTGPADADPAGTPSGGGVKSVPGTVDSAAAVECKGTSAAVVVLAMAASFLAAYVL